MIKYIIIGLILFLQLCNLSKGHLCLFDPPQREPTYEVPIRAGDNSCFRPYDIPCGNITAGSPVALYTAGSTIEVFFQQNYNHWYEPNPGYLDVSISYNGDSGTFIKLSETIADYNAWDMVTQTNYTVSINLPNKTCKSCVLRIRYVTNNIVEPTFYQCSDVAIQ